MGDSVALRLRTTAGVELAASGSSREQRAQRLRGAAPRLRLFRRYAAAHAMDAPPDRNRRAIRLVCDRRAISRCWSCFTRLRSATGFGVVLRNARSTRFVLASQVRKLAAHRMAVAAYLARSSLRAARSRGCMAAALSLGRVGAMGDQSTRMVRA